MAFSTTTSTPLTTSGAIASLAITAQGVNQGTLIESTSSHGIDLGYALSSLPVYGCAPIATQAGVYISPTPDFTGHFTLARHSSGWQAASTDVVQAAQQVLTGDQTDLASSAPLVTLTATDGVTLTCTSVTSGSLTLSVVQ